jgi:hypothetical protein
MISEIQQDLIEKELNIYKLKVLNNSIKESWIRKNLTNLYNFVADKEGKTISEKIYLISNVKKYCKVCNSETKFLSYNRGYQIYCSKKCSNNDLDIIKVKSENYKKTCISKYGVDNVSKSDFIIEKIKKKRSELDLNFIQEKIKKTNLERWGVDNPSKLDNIKKLKIKKSLEKWGVENPFQSDEIKLKIKNKLIAKFGVEHPMKSIEVKEKTKSTNMEKWGVDNPSKLEIFKKRKFSKYNNKDIETTINKDINFIEYLGNGMYKLKCDIHDHHFFINRHLYHSRLNSNNRLCTICYPVNENRSLKEKLLLEFIKQIYVGKVITSYRDGLEIDIYLPDLKLGFEINGLYWHSEKFKDKNYHLNKTLFFKEKGIRIIHIWEDDLINKFDIIKSQVENWIGFNKNKIFARNCQVKEISDVDIYRKFLNENHIQGYIRSIIKIGLFHNNELVSLMTFDNTEGRKKMEEGGWNLSRFCNKLKTNVVGGASKLLSYFINKYHPKRIISFADRDWSDGNLYFKLGFELVKITNPNYKYVVNKVRINKQRFKKNNLIKLGYNNELSESLIMENIGYHKVWDCGQIKFEKIIYH